MPTDLPVVYWDASAIISLLTADTHHEEARKYYESEGVHLLATLSYAEVLAVLSRLRREGHLDDEQLGRVCEILDSHPWRLVLMSPRREDIKNLAAKRPLRGADLWHLSLAVRLKREFPELALLTFDHKLQLAAEGEGLAANNK